MMQIKCNNDANKLKINTNPNILIQDKFNYDRRKIR